MSVTGTNLFRLRETDRDAGSTQESRNSCQQVSGNEDSAHLDIKEKNKIRLPALAKTKRLNHEEKNGLQALLRIRCYDFSLQVQGLKPEAKNTSKHSSFSSDSQSIEESSDQSQKETKNDCKEADKDMSSLSSSTVLEGQRVDLKEKIGLNNIERKRIHCQPTDKGKELFCLNNLRSENYRLENMIRSTIVSIQHKKQVERPVFHLPKVDRYDITPGHIKICKICSVFKLNDAEAPSTYTGLKDGWVPLRDRYFMNNYEFFKSLYVPPSLSIRQPSPVAGVKIHLREHEERSIEAVTHTVKETVDVIPPSVDTVVTKKVEKIVIRLPPIC